MELETGFEPATFCLGTGGVRALPGPEPDVCRCSHPKQEVAVAPTVLLIYRLVEVDDGIDLHGETGGALSGR